MARFGTFKIIEVLNNLNRVLPGWNFRKRSHGSDTKSSLSDCNYADLKIGFENTREDE